MKKNILIIVGIVLVILIIVAVILILKNKNRLEDFIHKEKDPSTYEEKDFNLRLIKTVNSTQEENYLVSPYSIEIALNMLREGSNNGTLEELDSVLPKREINVPSAKKRIGVANAVFLKDIYSQYIEKDFTKRLEKNYKADFIEDKFVRPDKINEWVKDNTYGMIPKLLNEMSGDFVLGIANAVAIDVEWLSSFECNNTKEATFTKADKEKMSVEMMHKFLEENAEYFETTNATGIILPYQKYNSEGEEVSYDQKGTKLEFVGILPKKDAFTYVENLTEKEFKEIDENKEKVNDDLNVRLSIPRFQYRFQLEKFKEVLMAMGIKSAFNSETADFSKIIQQENLQKMDAANLYVNTAIHKTYIDFNEKGTKAAAVTYFGLEKATAIFKEPRIVELNFDHSFVYMIRDSETKEMLFFGVVNTPNKWEKETCE